MKLTIEVDDKLLKVFGSKEQLKEAIEEVINSGFSRIYILYKRSKKGVAG